MALFKILKGNAANLPNIKTEGYCYVTTDTNRFYIDVSGDKRIELTVPQADNATYANNANILNCGTVGAENHPIFFNNGVPTNCGTTINMYVEAGKKSGTNLGAKATAEGYDTAASGTYSHAEGYDTIASGSNSHSEGNYATASGDNSHAEGFNTFASDWASHAEGHGAIASKDYSHAEGYYTNACGVCSHAEGYGTIASGANYGVHVQGRYNIDQGSSGTYIHIVGNGTSDLARSNAYTLDIKGNAEYAGRVNATHFIGNAAPISDLNTQGATGRLLGWNDIQGAFNGIYIGNQDSPGEDLTGANLLIKSWNGIGFVDGCTGQGMTIGFNCRDGNIVAKNNITAKIVSMLMVTLWQAKLLLLVKK